MVKKVQRVFREQNQLNHLKAIGKIIFLLISNSPYKEILHKLKTLFNKMSKMSHTFRKKRVKKTLGQLVSKKFRE